MKNIKTKATALALSTLMAVSAIGTASVSAATTNTSQNAVHLRTIYFLNNKKATTNGVPHWHNVHGFAWDYKDQPITTSFPGDKLTPIGVTKQYGPSTEVYSMTVDTDKVKGVGFNEGGHSPQQSTDIILNNETYSCFRLDEKNNAVPCKDFDLTQVESIGGSTTPTTPSTPSNPTTPTTPTTPSTPSTIHSNPLKNVDPICKTAPLKSDGSQTMYINSVDVSGSLPTVTFIRTGGSVAEATSVKPMYDGNGRQIYGMFEVKVPQGTFQAVDIQFDSVKSPTGVIGYRSEVNEATDTVKIYEDGDAVPCQRVYFNNNLSTMKEATQKVKAYAWNSVANVSESSFNNAEPMTYLKDDCYGVNVYFYDVPLTCDHIVFLTQNMKTSQVTAQTQDVKLNVTTNNGRELLIDGYYVSNTNNVNCQSVSLYDNQVKI